MVKPELYVDDEIDPETTEEGLSGWFTGTDGAFRLPYRADYKFGTGDYTIVQSFKATASGATRIATYDDYTASDGVRMSQTSDTFTVESGPVTVTLPSNPLDGTVQSLLVERESGVEVRAYLNDFDTAVATAVDAGADIDNTEPLDLAYDGTTRMDGLLGTTIVFTRLLEEWEKDEVFYWIESDARKDFEPEWLRTEAVLLVNPTDPVQRAEYGFNEVIVNLAVTPPSDTLYVRSNFTSTDGIANPEMSFFDFKMAEQSFYRTLANFAYDSGPTPALQLGHGEHPLVVTTGDDGYRNVSVPLESLSSTWLNEDWTINFWLKGAEDATADHILVQGDFTTFSVRDSAADQLAIYVNNIGVLATIGTPLYLTKYTMVTIRRSGNNFEMLFDASSVDTATNSVTTTASDPLTYAAPRNGYVGPLEIYRRALSDAQIEALFNSSPEANISVGGATVTVTSGFSTQELNWERI